MTTPNYRQYRILSDTHNGLNNDTIKTRKLACLAAFVSGQNPDGSYRT